MSKKPLFKFFCVGLVGAVGGIGMLLKVTQPDSRFSEENTSEFKGVKQVADIF